MKRYVVALVLILAGSMLAGCSSLLAGPTATPTSTVTPQPTATATATLLPTPTGTPVPSLGRGAGLYTVYDHQEYGFSIAISDVDQTLSEINGTIDGTDLYLQDGDRKFIIILWTRDYPEAVEFSDVIEDMFTTNADQFPGGQLNIDPYIGPIGGYPSRAISVEFTEQGHTISYRWFLVQIADDRLLFIQIGYAVESMTAKMSDEIIDTIMAIYQTLTIYEPGGETSLGDCLISNDPTYGRSMDNPIMVGGGSFGNLDEAPDYLANLYGPELEAISFYEVGVVEHDGVYLHEYEVSYEGLDDPIHIYINTDHWEKLMAPVGFTCLWPFSTGWLDVAGWLSDGYVDEGTPGYK